MLVAETFSTPFIFLCIFKTFALNVSKTENGLHTCVTECKSYTLSDGFTGNYCYWMWREWDYCKPGILPSLQYYTSKTNANNGNCTSRCGLFGDPGGKTWCYTEGSEGAGSWDYCSISPDTAVTGQPCVRPCAINLDNKDNPNETVCDVGGGNLIPCSKSPSSTEMSKSLNYFMEKKAGVFLGFLNFVSFGALKSVVCVPPEPSGRRARQVDEDEEEIRDFGVEMVAAHFGILYPNVVYPQQADPNNPVTEVVWEDAPFRAGLGNVQIVRSMRAIIRTTAPRTPIPPAIWTRMQDMEYVPGQDERGHLLAASFQGPNEWYNFAPQTNVLNRNFGFGGQPVEGSWWFRMEARIRDFLRHQVGGHVEWLMVITYDDLNVSRRPTGYGLTFTMYDAAGNQVEHSGDMFFNNDPTAENSVC